MPRGAGPGERRGGRQKGTPNKRTLLRAETLARLRIEGSDPVDFMLNVMKNPGVPLDMRLDAAARVAPFVHPRLQAVMHTQNLSGKSELQELIEELDGTSRGLPDYTDASGEWENGPPDSLDS
jgi:hypothetical protein